MKKIVRFAGCVAVCALVQGGAVAVSAAQAAPGMVNRPAQLKVTHNKVSSANWSGYAVQDSTSSALFTDVAGTWVEPTATCTSGQQFSSFWVGIDGYASNSVEQLGTDSDCNGSKPSYYAWYEMYPAFPVNLSKSKYPVKPGDTLTASVSVSDENFTLSISSSRGWSFSTVQSGTAALKQSSAEWVAEAPSSDSGVLPLADFGSVAFTNCTAAVSGGASKAISSFKGKKGPHEMTMAANGTTKATPSSLTSAGEAFGVTWDHK
jgi:hypothetical protein